MNRNIRQYDDIIDLPHHVSKRHCPMSMENRAAQFSPFAALTGYDAQVKEASRLTDNKILLSENEKELLDEKLRLLQEHASLRSAENHPTISVTFFQPDACKDGGEYITVTGIFKKLDSYKKRILLYPEKTIVQEQTENTPNLDTYSINIEDILEIDSPLFQRLEVLVP